MKHYQTILFDLDGTLTDPGVGITNSVAHALRRMGQPVPGRASLYPFIGPPLLDSFRRFCGCTAEGAARAVEYYREYYRVTGIFENRVYPGVPALLARLKQNGRQVVLATSKPEPFAVQILQHFGLQDFFDAVAGAAMDESRTDKAEVIEYALGLCGAGDKAAAVMVGDREHDVLGARRAGLDCIGVLFGYGSRAELEEAGALCLAATVEELGALLLG